MRIQTSLAPEVYRSAVKERMGSYFSWGAERFTGWFLGHVFYVTHHAGYEWNRRITNQKNAAFGYVRQTENGSEVRCFLFQGVLCPQYLLPYLLIFGIYLVLTWPVLCESPLLLVLSLLIIVGMPPVMAFIEACTDGSVEGRRNLLGLLIDPTDYFANLHYQNEIG